MNVQTVANLAVLAILVVKVNGSAFDNQLYEDVLDSELCEQQLEYLSGSNLRWSFLDASGKLPSGVLSGNINDLGDYHQCLNINQELEYFNIQGKYCSVIIPTDQPLPEFPEWPGWPDWPEGWPEWPEEWPNLPEGWPELPEGWPEFPEVVPEDRRNKINREINKEGIYSKAMFDWAHRYAGIDPQKQADKYDRVFPVAITVTAGMTFAVCVPQACTTRQALNHFLRLTPAANVTYHEYFCRLPNDKPWVTVDIVAIAIFSFIGLLIVLSTTYDLYQQFIIKRDSAKVNKLYQSFSVYKNGSRLLTFNKVPGALDCVDGIRAVSMIWVIVGHTFVLTLLGYIHNLQYLLEWMTSAKSTWIHSAPITVDTFFMLSGILAVYSTIGKISRDRFVRSIHLFYLNRLLRMTPLLATVVLLQASLLNHVADGPYWQNVGISAENCRIYWWAALLHVQNYVNSLDICVPQTWYLSVDIQLYIISPLVLLCLFNSGLRAWVALTVALLLSLVSSSIYSFTYNFSAALANPTRFAQFNDYVSFYYMNTLTRAPPFVIGLIYGYLLHLYRDRKIMISRNQATLLWCLSFLMMAFCIVSHYPIMKLDHEAQSFDNFLNAYMRGIWALGLGWLIFACVQGYGGPVNWFLSLEMWKLPARISYAMYLVHFPVMIITNATWVKTHYFSTGETLQRFMADIAITFLLAFVVTVAIDSPFSTLQKLLLGEEKKPVIKRDIPKIVEPKHQVTFPVDNKYVMKTAL